MRLSPDVRTLRACTCARLLGICAAALLALGAAAPAAARTQKPALHGAHWMAVTGKPLAATAGAMIFERGGNAVDAACAMIAATSTMWDTLSWGGETQALIYNPHNGKVIGINGLGVAPTGATPEYFHKLGMKFPPEYGPLAAVTPGTPGGLMTMLAEYGTMSLKQVLAPAIEMADGYPMEAELVHTIEKYQDRIRQWPESRRIMLIHPGSAHAAPEPGEMFHQPELAATLRKLVEAESSALKAGKDRKAAIYAAYDRFYRGDIAREFVRGVQEAGGLITLQDLDHWKVKIEEPVHTSYKGIEVYKLTTWVQGPVMLQTLNILENFDLKSMGYDSTRYIHTLYQAMNLAYADRDFYYGDPDFPPAPPIQGLLSKDYARARAQLVRPDRNDPDIRPGDPYPFQGGGNPFAATLRNWHSRMPASTPTALAEFDRSLPPRHHECRGSRRGRLGGLSHAQRRLGAGGDRRPHRRRPLATHAELRARCARKPLQRAGTGQAATRHAHPDPRPEGGQAAADLLGAGRRHPGPEPAAVFPGRGRVRHDGAGGDRGCQHHELPDARLLRRPRVLSGAPDAQQLHPGRRARRAYRHGLYAQLRGTQLRAH